MLQVACHWASGSSSLFEALESTTESGLFRRFGLACSEAILHEQPDQLLARKVEAGWAGIRVLLDDAGRLRFSTLKEVCLCNGFIACVLEYRMFPCCAGLWNS